MNHEFFERVGQTVRVKLEEWFNYFYHPTGFTEPWNVSNRVLLVDGEQFHVNSVYLSVHSDFFKALFNEEFNKKNEVEIEIKDVTADEFRNFLQLIYPGSLEITEENYKSLIDLSSRFLASGALDLCRIFIEKNFDKLDKFDLLEIAFKHNFNNVKESLSNYVKSQKIVVRYSCPVHPATFSKNCCELTKKHQAYPMSEDSFIYANRHRISKLPIEIRAFILQSIMDVV